MVIQLATLLLVLIYKQGMAVQPIDMPTRRKLADVRIELYIAQGEQGYIKLTILTSMKN